MLLGVIDRPRLIRQLSSASCAVVVLQAPAGYGKTVLIEQWLGRESGGRSRIVRLNLSGRDTDPAFFLRRLTRAVSDASPDQVHRADGRKSDPAHPEAGPCLDMLSEAVAGLSSPTRLVIDNCQHLAGSDGIAAVFGALLSPGHPELRLVLSGRGPVPVPLGRLRAQGHVVELHSDQLAFSEAEITELVRYATGDGQPNRARIDDLHARTEGWPAGVGLALRSPAPEPEPPLPDAWAAQAMEYNDFFREEVFDGLGSEVRSFLLRVSVVDEFSPEMASALSDSKNAGELIGRCLTAGAFLRPVDAACYRWRFHPGFRAFLRRELQQRHPEIVDDLHRRAALWLDADGSVSQAVGHALQADDHALAARILEARGDQLLAAGRHAELISLTNRLPIRVCTGRPRLMLTILAVTVLSHGSQVNADPLDVDHWIARFEQCLETMRGTGELDEPARLGLRDRLDALRLVATIRAYRLDEAEAKCVELINTYRERSGITASGLYWLLLHINYERLKLRPLEALEEHAHHATPWTADEAPVPSLTLDTVVARSRFLLGHTDRAVELLESALRTAASAQSAHAPLTPIPAMPLAEIHYELNEIPRARDLVAAHRQGATTVLGLDQGIPYWITRARLAHSDGAVDEASALLEEARAFALHHRNEKLLLAVAEEHIRLLLRQGDVDAARRVGRDAVLGAPAHTGTGGPVSVLEAYRAAAQARLAIAGYRLDEANALVRRWQGQVTARGVTYAVVKWDLLHCQIHLLRGEHDKALSLLESTVRLAAPGRFVRRFLDEGPRIGSLLAELDESPLRSAADCGDFLDTLLTAARSEYADVFSAKVPQQYVSGVAAPLSRREVEILRLAARGMPYRAIADTIELTEGSVKWYMQQIFDKLHVRRRFDAIEKARVLGFIA
ncbi:LuxR C-terminal-related transcriptional regulator [Streptomyces sp. NPDC051985]|uniref:LuxR C-terminal-related transcriptional regulator n=1 Tax=Streptomyces sp. NPDC051985 TaxID=3155807 RepID=UPI0034464449